MPMFMTHYRGGDPPRLSALSRHMAEAQLAHGRQRAALLDASADCILRLTMMLEQGYPLTPADARTARQLAQNLLRHG